MKYITASLFFGLFVPFTYSAQLRGATHTDILPERSLQDAETDNVAVLTSAGIVGGGGGSRFSDIPYLESFNADTDSSFTVSEVFIAGGDLITCVGMRYNNGQTRQYGNGCRSNRQTLQFTNDDYISRVEIWSTTQRYGVPPSCYYNNNFRSVSQIRVTSSSGEQIRVGTTSGHGTNFCRYTQDPQYSSVDVTEGSRYAVLGFAGSAGDLIDQLGVAVLEAPLFEEPTAREMSIPDQDFSTDVGALLTRDNKNVFIHNIHTSRHLNELQDGRITTSNDGKTPWEFIAVACPERSYALYADIHSGKTCYNIRNQEMDMYLGNNGVYAFAHSGTGDDDILGTYVLETNNQDCEREGRTVRCPTQIVSSFYTDRRVLADHDNTGSMLLSLEPTVNSGNPSRSNWVLVFEENNFDVVTKLAELSAGGNSIHIRNGDTTHFLNELQDGTIASVLNRTHQVGDAWTLVTVSCPDSVPDAECYALVKGGSDAASLTTLSDASLVFERTGENCFFSLETQEPLACPVRIVKPSNEANVNNLCLGQARGAEEVSFVDCNDQTVGYSLDWHLYF